MVWSEGNMSLKNPVASPGIDPGTIRLAAQHLNHYATPGPQSYVVMVFICGSIFMFFGSLFCSNMILLIYVAQHTVIVGYFYFVIKFWIILYSLFSSFCMERQ